MRHDTQHAKDVPGVAESRAHPRFEVHSLAYVELSDENAGLILNISETGIAVQAVQLLTTDQFARMRFRLPGTEIPIEAAGKLVWQIRSKKEAGTEFVGLSDATRAQIRNWIAAEPSRVAAAVARTQGKINAREETNRPNPLSEVKPAARPQVPSVTRPANPSSPVRAPSAAPDSAAQSQQHKEDFISRGRRPTAPRDVLAATAPSPVGGPSPPGPSSAPDSAVQSQHHGDDFRFRSRRLTPSPDAGIAPSAPSLATHEPATASSPMDRTSAEPAGYGWRSAPGRPRFGPDPGLPERPFRERAPVMPQWNGYMAPRVGMEYRKPRRWWTYTAAMGFIAVLAFAGLMMFNPDSINRARLEALIHEPGTTANDETKRSAQTHQNRPNKTPSASAKNSYRAPVQPYRSGDRVVPYTKPAPSSQAKGANQYAYRSGSQTQTSSSYQPPSNQPARSTQSANVVRQPQAGANPGASQTRPTGNSSTGNNMAGQKYPPQTSAPNSYSSTTQRAASPSLADQSALEAFEEQTALPPSSKTPVNTSGQSSNQQPASQRDQDASARPSSNTPSRAASQPQMSSVELPGSSSPVPPRVPLTGVPSGSVAATSRFHAIHIPPELQSNRSQLGGNLQIGQLISSYFPAYPIGAAREGIEGTVKLDVLVGRDGTVRSVTVLNGPPMLASAAASAVRDWRYGETFLAGQPVETQQYVTIIFQLAK
jgi:TonB family protein